MTLKPLDNLPLSQRGGEVVELLAEWLLDTPNDLSSFDALEEAGDFVVNNLPEFITQENHVRS